MLREDARGGNPLAMPCPRCRCAGNYVAHGSYLRHVVHRGREERVAVRRVRCMGCMATHAVIPPGVVPYRQFSEGLVLAVLAAWASGSSNAEVRRAYGISETTRRRMLAGARRRACALLVERRGQARVRHIRDDAQAHAGGRQEARLRAAGLRRVEGRRRRRAGLRRRGRRARAARGRLRHPLRRGRQIKQCARARPGVPGALHIGRRLAGVPRLPHHRACARNGARA